MNYERSPASCWREHPQVTEWELKLESVPTASRFACEMKLMLFAGKVECQG